MSPIDRLLYRLMLRDIAAPWQWPKGTEHPQNWEPTSFTGPSGQPLVGLFGRADGVAKAVVVCAHPVRPDAKGFYLRSGVARLLREAGYHVLLFDFNGFGESPPSTFNYAGDALAAAHEAQRLAPGLPLVLFGACFGASVSLPVLAQPDNPFRAAVVEGAPLSWDSYFAMPMSVRPSLRQRLTRLRGRAVIAFGARLHKAWVGQMDALSPLQRVHNVAGVLFLYGHEDPLIPAHVGQTLYETCRASWALRADAPAASLWISPRTRHLCYYAADPAGYRQALVDFLDIAVRRPADALADNAVL